MTAAQVRYVAPDRASTAGLLSFGQLARRLRDNRRIWREALGDELSGDPAWDMLIDLFIARAEGKRTTISALCTASGAPSSTALRWVATLELRNLMVRRADPCDRRRFFALLTPAAVGALEEAIRQTARNWDVKLHDTGDLIGFPAESPAIPVHTGTARHA